MWGVCVHPAKDIHHDVTFIDGGGVVYHGICLVYMCSVPLSDSRHEPKELLELISACYGGVIQYPVITHPRLYMFY
jgi:hypothetical protein